MIELRPALNEAINNIQKWRQTYSKNVYPSKIVINMLYRAYSTRCVYNAFLNDELVEFEDFNEAVMYVLQFYGRTAVSEVMPNLEKWINNNPFEEVGTICAARYQNLANKAINDISKKEELEFSYIFEMLNDMSVLYYIAFRLSGCNDVEAIAKMTGAIIEKIPNMNYTIIKQVFQQLLVSRYMNNNYRPLP